MSQVQNTISTFESPGVSFLYDVLVRTIYLPVGGEGALRKDAIARLGLAPGQRVLELGCGTGSFTARLLEQGAHVTAVDGSERMLDRARSKAPGASFERADLRTFRAPAEATFELVFFGFVLHELERSVRVRLLAEAARCLSTTGRVVIVDHAAPHGGGFARVWREFLVLLEPESVRAVLAEGYESELKEAGFDVVERSELGRGTAQLLVGRRATSC